MRENRTSGSVQGASGNGRSYCERQKKYMSDWDFPTSPHLE